VLSSSGPYIALAALLIVVALAGIAYWTTRRQDRIEAAQRAILGEGDRRDLVTHALDLEEQVRNLREAVTILSDEVEHYRHDLDASLSNMALVRFDAFRDSGGEQSASIALLDNYRSGVVISVYAAREFARIYVKYLDHGVPDRELAPEEEEAVRRAVPQALPRGELSRAPVSSFPRDVRRAVEQARKAAAQPPQAAGGPAGGPGGPPTAAGPGAGPGGLAPGTVPASGAGPHAAAPGAARPPRYSVSTDEAELGFDWIEGQPGEQPGEEAYVEATMEIPGLEHETAQIGGPPGAAPAAPQTPGAPGRAGAGAPPTAAGTGAPPRAAAPPPAMPSEPAEAATPAEATESAETAATRKSARNDDWLGGDDLDF